ncbi:unnamed protein product [Chrysoparadoxa australica]
MVDDGVDLGACNKFGESVVHLAARSGKAEVLQLVLSKGGSLRTCDDYGKTPVHDACWTGEPHFDILRMILAVDWKMLLVADIRGSPPLAYARKHHWHLWCQFFDEVKEQLWPKHVAAR